MQTAICFKLTKQWLSRAFSNVKSRLSYSAKTKLYDVRTISGDWPQRIFEITWAYALTYIRNLLDDYMAMPSQKAIASKTEMLSTYLNGTSSKSQKSTPSKKNHSVQIA